MRAEGQGLGLERPDDVDADDDEYDAYRKRMMLAYRFRPNPMVKMYFSYSIYLFSSASFIRYNFGNVLSILLINFS